MSIQTQETASQCTNTFFEDRSLSGTPPTLPVCPQECNPTCQASRPKKRLCVDPAALISRIKYLEAALEQETRRRHEEAIQANTTCSAYHEMAVAFCASNIASERDYRRTIKQLQDHVMAWEAWGSRARVVLARNGLLKATAADVVEDAADSCSVASADECTSQC